MLKNECIKVEVFMNVRINGVVNDDNLLMNECMNEGLSGERIFMKEWSVLHMCCAVSFVVVECINEWSGDGIFMNECCSEWGNGISGDEFKNWPERPGPWVQSTRYVYQLHSSKPKTHEPITRQHFTVFIQTSFFHT